MKTFKLAALCGFCTLFGYWIAPPTPAPAIASWGLTQAEWNQRGYISCNSARNYEIRNVDFASGVHARCESPEISNWNGYSGLTFEQLLSAMTARNRTFTIKYNSFIMPFSAG
jgi:hypothetical protein